MEKIITRLQHLVNQVPRLLQAFSPDEMTHRPAQGKWSKREILGHLCDSALHNWQRFNLAQQTDEALQIIRYQQDALVSQNNWQALPTGQIAELWASLNTQILAVLKNLPKEKLAHPIVLPDGTPNRLQFLIEDYLIHLEHHLGQIFQKEIAPPTLPRQWQFGAQQALDILSKHPNGKPFVSLLEKGKMYVEIYRPQQVDLQQPHDQDEIYVVISGTGLFFNNGETSPFRPGDLIFVPVGVEHRFLDFTEDFATWVVFC